MLERHSEVEDSLVRRAQGGDRNAFGELAGRHYDRVIHVVYRLCGDAQLAQDATQEAFIRAWLKLPQYQPRAPFQHWLYRIAVNTALDMLRQKPEAAWDENEDMQTLADMGPGPEAAYLAKEQALFVQDAIRALPEAARAVLVLREYGELSYHEIASVLDVPVGTVMSRLNYARTRLRERLLQTRLETERAYA